MRIKDLIKQANEALKVHGNVEVEIFVKDLDDSYALDIKCGVKKYPMVKEKFFVIEDR